MKRTTFLAIHRITDGMWMAIEFFWKAFKFIMVVATCALFMYVWTSSPK